MKEYTIQDLNNNQAKIAAKNAPKVEVKAQVSKIVPMYFNDKGERIIEQVKEEVKTNVTKVNFKSAEMNITSVTHVENESEFLM